MAPRLDYYFRETASGLRRNGIVAFAAMSTAFIALFLLGLALLIGRQFNLMILQFTKNVQVAVYLSDPVRPETVERVQTKLGELSAVSDGGSIEYWDKQATCEEFQRMFEGQPVFSEDVDCEATIPTSFRINLGDTGQYGQITAALGCDMSDTGQFECAEPGVLRVSDHRQVLARLSTITRVLSIGILSVAVIMLVSAVVLVANTLRMGMFARRKEIGIMRLVGATNWRIRAPFLIEGLAEALLGAAAAILALFLVKVVFIDRIRDQVQFFPLIKNADVMAIAPWILVAAAVVAIIAGTVGMRRFLDV